MPLGLAEVAQLSYSAMLVPLALFGLHRLHLLSLAWRYAGADPIQPTLSETELPRVTVQLPVFNEPQVVARLIRAAGDLDWPSDRLQIQLLDDSTDETCGIAEEELAILRARGIDACRITRPDRHEFKAGALSLGTRTAMGEFFLIFDADFAPPPHFLRATMGHFADPQMGMVQTRWGHRNRTHSALTDAQAALLDGHFSIEHRARNRSGRFFNFNGTAGIWRKQCLEEAGGWSGSTLTEDLDLSYRAQLAGWRFLYLDDVEAPAELPTTLPAFRSQQRRWAAGTTQVARKLLPRLLRAPLPVKVRLEALSHLCANLGWPMVLILGLLFPIAAWARREGGGLDGPDWAVLFLNLGVSSIFYLQAGRLPFHQRLLRLPLTLMLSLGMALSQSRAFIAGLFDRQREFVRTPKVGDHAFPTPSPPVSSRSVWTWDGGLPELTLAAYHLAWFAYFVGTGWLAPLPFLALLGLGNAWVGYASLPRNPLLSGFRSPSG